MKQTMHSKETWLLIILMGIDLFLVIMNCLHHFGVINDYRFVLWAEGRQGGITERVEYVKLFFIVVSLMYIGLYKKNVIYFIWSLLFFYLLLDNYYEIHENMGLEIANQLQLAPVLVPRARDIGELIVYLLFGISVLSLAIVSKRKNYQLSYQLFQLTMLYAVFAVGVDMLHIIIETYWYSGGLVLGTIEDGGENVVFSLILWWLTRSILQFGFVVKQNNYST